jgi:lysosomal alpha-mannosidase
MEFVWRPTFDQLGSSTQIFTHTLYNLYSSPVGFGFDILEKDMISGRNSGAKAKEFLDYATKLSKAYKTNHLLIPMGGDFGY